VEEEWTTGHESAKRKEKNIPGIGKKRARPRLEKKGRRRSPHMKKGGNRTRPSPALGKRDGRHEGRGDEAVLRGKEERCILCRRKKKEIKERDAKKGSAASMISFCSNQIS